MGEESDSRPPEERPFYREAVRAPDLITALRAFVSGVGEMERMMAPLVPALVGAEGSRDADDIAPFHEEWRADGYRAFLDVLLTKAPLRPGLTPERATHLLLFYVDVGPYRMLVNTYGWTHAEWIEWTAQTIADQVFDPGDL